MTDRKLLAFYPSMQPVQEVAAGDAAAMPHAVVEKTLALPGYIDVNHATADDIHDWAPTGYEDAAVWRISTGESNVTITGMAAGRPGQIRTLLNVGGEDVIFAQNGLGSAVGNQFLMGWNFAKVLSAGGSATFIYDPPIPGIQDFGYWRLIAAPGATFTNS